MAEKTFDNPSDPGADSAPDANTQIKKRARRRLVGAIALALFAVIALPVVMDREPPPSGPEIQIRIPSQESAPATASLPKPASAKAPAEVAIAPKSEPVAEAPKPEAKAAITDGKPVPTEPAKPVKSAENQTEKADKARAEAALAGAGSKPPAAAENGDKWIVQLGAYQSSGNVVLLMGKIKEMKIPAYTDKVNTPQGSRTRVRAGPFASKDAAQKAADRIKILGVNGPVAPVGADKP